MAEVMQEAGKGFQKRKVGHKKGSKGKKKMKNFQASVEKVRVDRKMKKLLQKKAREYNSDDDEEVARNAGDENELGHDDDFDGKSSDEEGEDYWRADKENEFSDDEDGEIQPGITKFAEGCKAFRMAFKKITKRSASDGVLGPVLSAHKNLVAEKLAEEESERKVKGEAKKEKHLVGEKGHVKPSNYLDSHEKFLIGVATKGVVKLFNAVNKAQNSQKGLNLSRSKDAKAIKKRRKEAFFSELGKTSSQSTNTLAKVDHSGPANGEGPAWGPMRDNYMLTSSKLKDWDKKQETTVEDDLGRMSDSSSDDD